MLQENTKPKPTGKQSEYSQAVVEQILERIAEGEFLTRICAEEGMPARPTFYKWMKERPAIVDAFARAKLLWADTWAERGLLIALDSSADFFLDESGKVVEDRASVQRARLQCDQIKWTASKYAPRTYGDRPIPDEEPKTITFQWLSGTSPEQPPEPPRQIEYRKPELPADMTESDWSIMLEVLELVERTVPTNDERPPEEIFGVMKAALLAHFRETA